MKYYADLEVALNVSRLGYGPDVSRGMAELVDEEGEAVGFFTLTFCENFVNSTSGKGWTFKPL